MKTIKCKDGSHLLVEYMAHALRMDYQQVADEAIRCLAQHLVNSENLAQRWHTIIAEELKIQTLAGENERSEGEQAKGADSIHRARGKPA